MVITLIMIAYQDIKSRAIHVALPVVLLCTSGYMFYGSSLPINQLLPTVLFILVCLAGIVIHFSIKNRRLSNPFDIAFGLGDVFFLVAIIPLFTFRNYLLCFVAGMLFSLITSLIVKLITKNELIPLAGYLSIFLLVVFVYQWCCHPNLNYTDLF